MGALSYLGRFFVRTIRGRISLLVAAVLFPAAVLASWLILRSYANARQAVERNLMESAQALTLLADALLREQEARLLGLATSVQLARNDLRGFRLQAEALQKSADTWYVLVEPTGRQVLNTSQPVDAELPQMTVADEVREALRAGRTYVSNFAVGPATGRSTVYVARGVPRRGHPPVALSAVLTTDVVAQVLLASDIGQGRLISLIDRDGRIIVRSRDPATYVGQYVSDWMRETMGTLPHGIRESVTLDGVASFTAFNRSSYSGWTVILAAPRSELLAGSRTMSLVAGVVSLICGAVAVLLAVWLGRAVVGAVALLVGQARSLGDAPMPAPDTGIDETDIVARALTEAGRKLRAHATELARARDEALASSRAKDEFLATLSHELRTPLNPVLLEASEAAADPRLPAEVREIFESIARNVQLEARLIDDLLDLTRITRGKVSFEMSDVDVHTILRDSLRTVRGLAEEKRIVVETDFAAGVANVRGDATRLQQVFWNLLSNALKFTADGGHVSIATASDAERITITIVDSGIGLSRQELLRIFRPFEQGEHAGGAGGHRFGGLGLGLAITRLLVEKHGGSVSAASPGRGKGATFRVNLPLIGALGADVDVGSTRSDAGEQPEASPQ